MTSTQDAAEAQKMYVFYDANQLPMTSLSCIIFLLPRLGNEEFNAKNFDKAVECYSEAIRLDPENFVYYSNRSAALGALGKWELAEQDAQECVKRNPTFAKGYHRVANAQQQLGRKKEAIETLKTAQNVATDLDKMPGIKKLLRQLTQEVAPKSAAPSPGGSRHVPTHIAKELQELQPQFLKLQHELAQIEAKLAATTRQKKRLALVEQEMAELPAGTKTYRSVGKMFLQTNPDENTASMKSEEKWVIEQLSSLEARKNYLSRQKQSVEENITELLAQCT
ncbi:hypothetical protein PsorP6_003230 [Peronosclerospora sorghi]|uniref:Uncharacterized protein n=1 Tax=Peronosclerospora sorghi TaxID=230839 RepID=A0ACC0VQ45_9STRA|nr:hypothetical protein PsorP6_003230 [Peronosclerospora sorghi]